jgi:hypothetical protein
MSAIDVRLVGLELKTNVAGIKATVDALQTAVDAIDDVTSVWVLNGADNTLPAASAVKAQLTAYEELVVSVSKPTNTINDSIATIKATA